MSLHGIQIIEVKVEFYSYTPHTECSKDSYQVRIDIIVNANPSEIWLLIIKKYAQTFYQLFIKLSEK